MPVPEFDPNQPYQSVDNGESQTQAIDQKPEFDPNQPFQSTSASSQEDDTSKPAFDPNQPFEDTKEKYGTTGQQALTMAEGLGQGFAGPVATGLEKGLNALGVPGLTNEDIVARRNTNPKEFLGSEVGGLGLGLMTGTGEAGLLAKAFGPAVGATKMARIGSGALKAGIQSGLIQGGNEISKGLLGQADPETPVATALMHSGAAGLFGLGLGTLFGSMGEGAAYAQEANIVNRTKGWLYGFGKASLPKTEPIEAPVADIYTSPNTTLSESRAFQAKQQEFANEPPTGFDKKAMANGEKSYNDMVTNQGYHLPTAVKIAGKISAPIIGAVAGGPLGVALGQGVEYGMEKVLEKALPFAARKYAAPVFLKAASNGTLENGANHLIKYATSLGKGDTLLTKGVQSLFKAGAPESIDYSVSEDQRNRTKEYIENGGAEKDVTEDLQNPQGYATGGKVRPLKKPNSLETNLPEQNMLLNAAKMRVSNYLNASRPIPSNPKIPFDTFHKDPQKERDYDKLVDLANKPSLVFKHMKDGTLLPKHVSDFKAMYPEMHNHISKKLTEEMMQHKFNETTKPKYHIRQAMSLFLGTDLDSTLTQPSMFAAQNVFAQQNAQKQLPQTKLSSLGNLGKASQTPDQSREARLNKT